MLLGATRSLDPGAELAGLPPQRLGLEHAVEDDEQLVEVDRLGEVLGRAGAHRVDRGLDRPERRHHDDGRGVLERLDLLDTSSMPSMPGILRSVTTT